MGELDLSQAFEHADANWRALEAALAAEEGVVVQELLRVLRCLARYADTEFAAL